MLKGLQHIIVSMMLLFSFTKSIAQIAMPDTVCVGTNRIYQVNDAARPSTYTWKIDQVIQSSVTNKISVTWNNTGTFLLTVQEHAAGRCDGDIRSGLVYVKPLPVANAGPDAIICFGKNGQLNGSGGNFYQWSPAAYLSNVNSRNPVIISPPTGTLQYILKVTDAGGCTALKDDTVKITITSPIKIFAGNDTSIAINQPLQLNALDINNGFVNYLWSPSFGLNSSTIKNPVALFNSVVGNNGITYTITAGTAEGCVAKDDIRVKVFIAPEIYVPNAFTPNGDGLNDVVRPICAGIKELKYFTIFNRYGQIVFTTTIQTSGWNGLFKGVGQNNGAFVWIARGIDYRGNVIDRKGTVLLIR